MVSNFTRLMAVAAAALLVAMPVSAQQLAKKLTAQKPKMTVLKQQRQTPSEAKAAFRQQAVQQKQAAKAVRHHAGGVAFRTPQPTQCSVDKTQKPLQTPLRDSRPVFRPYAFGSLKAPQRTFRASGEVTDEHGIIVAPAEGTRQVFNRSGMMYVNEDGMQTVAQSGQVHLVECADGTVYIRNILASYPTGAWVKGQADGDKIIVNTRQPIAWNPLANVTFSIGWGYVEESWGTLSFSYYGGETITFTIDQETKTITMDAPNANCFLGLFWDDDDAFANFGDFGTVWNYVGPFEPMQPVEVAAPAVESQQWYIRAHNSTDGDRQVVKGTAQVAISGSDIYIKGVFADYADGWMKGTADADGVVTFQGLQKQGTYEGQPVYAVGMASGDLVPFQMTYDAQQHVLKSVVSLVANVSNSDVAAVDAYDDITITLADPFAPIETLPYSNAIDTEDNFEWFTVIDANNDGYCWSLFTSDGQACASLRYNSDEAADDWLISPAFRLEAGKTYTMAVDMNASSEAYAERFEVKMGTAATAEAMTQQVIEVSEVSSEQPLTFQNKLVTVPETGVYYFGIHGMSDADQASLRASNFFVDVTNLDAPVAVTNLAATAQSELGQVVIAFNAPTVSIGGNELTDNMTIDIQRDGETIYTFSDVAPGSEQTYTDTDAAPGKHLYTVTTYNAGGKGESATVTATLSTVLDIPFVGDFSEDGMYDLFTAINANDDGAYWSDNGFYAAYEYSSDNAADDYLVTPGLLMEAGKRYAISIDAEAAGDYPERFEVVVGREASAEALTTKVIEPVEILGSEGRMTYEGMFACEESGVYYVAVHCISDADMYALWVHKLTVDHGPALTAPAAPALQVTPGAEGALTASFSITAPATTVEGNSLESITKVELYCDDALVNEFTDVTPGAVITGVDADITENGVRTYYAVAYNADGKGVKSAKVKAYVGIDQPADVANVKVKDLGTSVQLSWDAVTTVGANGGYVNPAEVVYKVYACEPNSTWIDGDPVATVQGETSCTLDFDPSTGEQGYQGWVVVSSNEVGETSLYDASLVTLTTGEPYVLPVIEGFADGRFHYYCDYVGLPLVTQTSSDADGVSLALASQQDNTLVAFTTGKISIDGAQQPTLQVDAASFGADQFAILAAKDGDPYNAVTLAQNIAINNSGYTTVTVDLSSLKDAHYVLLAFMAHIPTGTVLDDWTGEIVSQGDALILDNIRVFDKIDHNLAVSLSAPETLQAGNATGVLATVSNWGQQPATGFTVTVTAGDKVLSEQTVTDPLGSFESTTIVANLSTDVFTPSGDLPLTVRVDYAADQQVADNEAAATIVITEPVAPAPTNLTAEDKGDAGVDLQWTAPAEMVPFTESFEDGMGGWTAIDADKDGFNWTQSIFGQSENNMETNSGLGCIYSESYSNSAQQALSPDNWLVSPELVLDGELSFYAKGQDPNYCAEHFAVYVTTGAYDDLSGYTQVSDELIATSDFQQYTVDLSQYAGQKGFVAIRHYNVTDMFTLVVDDITYTMGGQPVAYYIYCDGQLVGLAKGQETTYTVAAYFLEAGERTFAISAVYGNGQESRPVTATALVTTDIRQVATDGQPVDVFSLDGKLVRRQATTFSGLHGFYVVNGQKVMVK